MLLREAVLYSSGEKVDIRIRNGKIESVEPDLSAEKTEDIIELSGATVFPGFINSHDHLDFNCYPQLGNGAYKNYTEWGHDIHAKYAEEIAAVKKTPESLRVQWGLYKNLLNGFTTVIHHGQKLYISDDLVNVFQDCHSLHSVAFEKNWKQRLNNLFSFRKPYVIHAGEGTDERAEKEIDQLVQSNYLRKKLVAVHGVAMKEEQAASFKGLVWCPASNYFLLGKTAAIDRLKAKTTIVLGTDSTLTADWNLKKHITDAMHSGLVTEKELVQMLTTSPASLWGLHHKGIVAAGMDADLTILGGNKLVDSVLLLVIKQGEVVVVNEKLKQREQVVNQKKTSRIKLGTETLQVKGDLQKLVKDIQSYYPLAHIPFELL